MHSNFYLKNKYVHKKIMFVFFMNFSFFLFSLKNPGCIVNQAKFQQLLHTHSAQGRDKSLNIALQVGQIQQQIDKFCLYVASGNTTNSSLTAQNILYEMGVNLQSEAISFTRFLRYNPLNLNSKFSFEIEDPVVFNLLASYENAAFATLVGSENTVNAWNINGVGPSAFVTTSAGNILQLLAQENFIAGRSVDGLFVTPNVDVWTTAGAHLATIVDTDFPGKSVTDIALNDTVYLAVENNIYQYDSVGVLLDRFPTISLITATNAPSSSIYTVNANYPTIVEQWDPATLSRTGFIDLGSSVLFIAATATGTAGVPKVFVVTQDDNTEVKVLDFVSVPAVPYVFGTISMGGVVSALATSNEHVFAIDSTNNILRGTNDLGVDGAGMPVITYAGDPLSPFRLIAGSDLDQVLFFAGGDPDFGFPINLQTVDVGTGVLTTLTPAYGWGLLNNLGITAGNQSFVTYDGINIWMFVYPAGAGEAGLPWTSIEFVGNLVVSMVAKSNYFAIIQSDDLQEIRVYDANVLPFPFPAPVQITITDPIIGFYINSYDGGPGPGTLYVATENNIAMYSCATGAFLGLIQDDFFKVLSHDLPTNIYTIKDSDRSMIQAWDYATNDLLSQISSPTGLITKIVAQQDYVFALNDTNLNIIEVFDFTTPSSPVLSNTITASVGYETITNIVAANTGSGPIVFAQNSTDQTVIQGWKVNGDQVIGSPIIGSTNINAIAADSTFFSLFDI